MKARVNRKISIFTRILALIICFCLMIPVTVLADSIEEAQARQDALAAEKETLETEIEALKNDEQKAIEYQEALEAKIAIVQKQIDNAIAQIKVLDDGIKELEIKLDKSEAEIQDTMDLFKQQVKALYISGSTTDIGTLEILLNSTSLSDLSYKSEALKMVAEYDEQVMDKIKVYMDSTEAERADLKSKKEDLAETKKNLEKSNKELEELNKENQIALENIKEAKAEKEDKISENEAESASLQEEIATLIAAKKAADEEARRQAAANASSGGGATGENNGSDTPDANYDGSFNPCWPIPGVSYISQHYGNNGHKGIDIAGPYGTPIVAAESGQVIMGNDGDSWGDSWGYYVLIYHNGTFTTRYAHLSQLTVSTGQYVSKGQTIGYEGSTGNSTGPHLHFEVYQNGYRVDPWPYIGY